MGWVPYVPGPFHVTVANYEYLVYWRFFQDGNIECEVRATGIMVTSHFAEGDKPPYGTVVDQRTYAPFHQHFIVARLDLDVDGPNNTVYVTESVAADRLEARAGEFAEAESQNTGKPLGLTKSEEIPPMVDQIRFFAGAARCLEGRSTGEYGSST